MCLAGAACKPEPAAPIVPSEGVELAWPRPAAHTGFGVEALTTPVARLPLDPRSRDLRAVTVWPAHDATGTSLAVASGYRQEVPSIDVLDVDTGVLRWRAPAE